jgi:hypothetical protein
LTPPGGLLPITAVSQLDSTDLDGALIGQAQSFSEVADPARLDQPNPEDLALEAGCYANGSDVSYDVASAATENRDVVDVVFVRTSRPGVPREIEFGPDGTAEIRSRVFLSGAILLWSTQEDTDLTAVVAEVLLSVTKDAESESLFEAGVSVSGSSAPELVGPLGTRELSVDDLADYGLDEASTETLRNVAETGALRIVAIPTQSHRYSYVVAADEEFVLAARLTIALRNAPGGTGAAAVLGRPFSNLADFVEQAIGGVDGASLERSLNKAIESGAVDPSIDPGIHLCGNIGAELALMPAPLAFLRVRRRSRRRPPTSPAP